MSAGWVAWAADALVLLALAVISIGVYGLRRMPDVYTQLHATSKAVFLGVIAVLAAVALGGDLATVSRAVLIGMALLLTTPVSAHVIARAAYELGEPMATPGAIDESGRDLNLGRGGRKAGSRRAPAGRQIVVGYDGSDHARRALERAAALAGGGGTVTLVTARRLLPASPDSAGRELHEYRSVLREGRGRLQERGVAVRVIESLADPAKAIVDAAREVDADLIVVGTRGRSAPARSLLGSVSAEVAEHAPCAVEIV